MKQLAATVLYQHMKVVMTMIPPNIQKTLAAFLCTTLLLAACSDNTPQPSPVAGDGASFSSPLHSSAPEESPSSSQSVSEPDVVRPPVASSKPPAASSPPPAPSSQPPAAAPNAPSQPPSNNSQPTDDNQGFTLTVISANVIESKELVIRDEAQLQTILAFVESMFESDYKGLPNTGGTVIDVRITQDGTTRAYAFLDEGADGYNLAKDLQHPDVRNTWFFADPEAYAYLSSLFQ